jgi:hypothetical protein
MLRAPFEHCADSTRIRSLLSIVKVALAPPAKSRQNRCPQPALRQLQRPEKPRGRRSLDLQLRPLSHIACVTP